MNRLHSLLVYVLCLLCVTSISTLATESSTVVETGMTPMTLTIGGNAYRFWVNLDKNLIWSLPCGEDAFTGGCEATRALIRAKWNQQYLFKARGGQRLGSFYCSDQAKGQRIFADLPNSQRVTLCRFSDGSMTGLETLVEFASRDKPVDPPPASAPSSSLTH